MKKIIVFSILAPLLGCTAKADNEMKELCHEVINKNRGVMIRFEPVDAAQERK